MSQVASLTFSSLLELLEEPSSINCLKSWGFVCYRNVTTLEDAVSRRWALCQKHSGGAGRKTTDPDL